MVRYAPTNAPEVGKGRWAWPPGLTENKKLIEKIMRIGEEMAKERRKGGRGKKRTAIQERHKKLKNEINRIARKEAKKTKNKTENKKRYDERRGM